MSSFWLGVVLVVLGAALTLQEFRWWQRETSTAFLEAVWDLVTKHLLKIVLGPILIYLGLVQYHSPSGQHAAWEPLILLFGQKPTNARAPIVDTGIIVVVLCIWVAATSHTRLLPAWLGRVLMGIAYLCLSAAFLATCWWNFTHIGGEWWCDLVGAILLLCAFAEIRDGVMHSDIGIYVGGRDSDENSWWIGLGFWQGTVDLQTRPLFFIFCVLITLALSALFAWAP